MTNKDFQKHFEHRVLLSRETLIEKAKEYASKIDRMHNFVRAGAVLNCTREEACLAFAVKHFVSIQDMVNYKGPFSELVIQEKLGDMINYMILLEAMLLENSEKS